MSTSAPVRGRPHTKPFDGTYEVLPDIELSPEQEAKARQLIDAADAEHQDARVTLRWGKAQLDIIRRAARLAGVPYQTYLKAVAIRAALHDLKTAREADVQT